MVEFHSSHARNLDLILCPRAKSLPEERRLGATPPSASKSRRDRA